MASDWQVEDRHNLLTHHFRIGNRATSDCRPHRDSDGITKIRRSINSGPRVGISEKHYRLLPFDVWLSIGFWVLLSLLWLSPFGLAKVIIEPTVRWRVAVYPDFESPHARGLFYALSVFGIPLMVGLFGVVAAAITRRSALFVRIVGGYAYISTGIIYIFLAPIARQASNINISNVYLSINSTLVYMMLFFNTWIVINIIYLYKSITSSKEYNEHVMVFIYSICTIGSAIPLLFIVGAFKDINI